jgi:hypothetical protein
MLSFLFDTGFLHQAGLKIYSSVLHIMQKVTPLFSASGTSIIFHGPFLHAMSLKGLFS